MVIIFQYMHWSKIKGNPEKGYCFSINEQALEQAKDLMTQLVACITTALSSMMAKIFGSISLDKYICLKNMK